jgi:phosphate starvation-inducible protein PhoH and related proteins
VPNSLQEERHLQRRLKRSNRANPREDRNIFEGKNVRNNIIELEQFSRHLKQRVELIPKNLTQEKYIEKLEDPNTNIVFAVGPAGTGKSYLATLWSIQSLKNGTAQKVVITRPSISLDDKDIGFLPGDIFSKMAPWTRPILEIFEEFYTTKQIATMLENNVIELLPMAYIRGRTLKNSVILLDESQNTTPSSMQSALTRIGEGSKMIVTGDTKQSDRGTNNGLTDFLARYKTHSRVAVVEFEQRDVERHPVISTILGWYGEN